MTADQPALRDQLVAVIAPWHSSLPAGNLSSLADALLPLIEADRERAKAEAAADALEQAANELHRRAYTDTGEGLAWEVLRARAKALRGST